MITNDKTVEELVAKAKSGDNIAMETLLVQFKGLVCKHANSINLKAGADTDDLIQEGTIGLWKAILDYDPEKKVPFISFASTCVANKIRDAARHYQREKHAILNNAMSIFETNADGEPVLDKLKATTGTPLYYYRRNELAKEFHEELKKIANAEEILIIERRMYGLSYQEIAEELGIPEKKVDNLICSVKNKIKKHPEIFEKML